MSDLDEMACRDVSCGSGPRLGNHTRVCPASFNEQSKYPHLYPVPPFEEEAEYDERTYEQAAHDAAPSRPLRLLYALTLE
jgi:hypothetical protein